MLNVHLDKQSVAATRKILEDLGESFDKAINVAISKTVKKVKTQASRRLRQVIAAPTKVLKRAVTRGKVSKRSNVVSVTVYLQAGHPIPLKCFKPTSPKKRQVGRHRPRVCRNTPTHSRWIYERQMGQKRLQASRQRTETT